MILPSPKNEDGTTMVELLVGLSMGMIVLAGLSMTIIAVMHGTGRVNARVESTDNARVAVAQLMEELHSACVSPQIAPVRPTSSGTSLVFWHAASGQAGQVQPVPVRSVISYSGGALTQTDYANSGGTSPNWEFEATGVKRTLLSNVAPPSGSTSIFTYEKYEGGKPKLLKATGLSEAEAKVTVIVKVALAASARSTPVADRGSAATIRDSASLRLTPPSYNQAAAAPPCQ